MIFRRSTYLITFVMVLMLLCSCGASNVVTSTTTQGAIPQYTLPPVIKEPVPTSGGEFTFPIPNNPPNYNPLKIKNVELNNFFSLIYEKPIRIGVDGKALPELVETWSVDETGLIWNFTLRQGVNWQKDYGEVTTADLLYTIGLIKTYTSIDSMYARYNNIVASCTAIDAYTLAVTLTEPGNAALYFMTFPVLCKAYCDSSNIDVSVPVGSGPYVISSFNMPDSVTFEANTAWWKTQPYIQKLTAIGYTDHNTEMAGFQQNLLDVVTTSTLTVDTYQKHDQIEYVDYLTQYYDCLIPNNTGVFSDLNLRQALAYALDKRDVISQALLGHAVAADYPVPPDSYLSGGSSNIYEYNQQKALEMLELSGWKDRDDDGLVEKVEGSTISDLTFTLLVPAKADDSYRHDVAENIANQLKKSGMTVVINEVPRDIYLQSLQTKNFDLALCTFYLDTNPDITDLVGTGGVINYGGFTDSEMDTLLTACKSSTNDVDMKQAYLALEDRFLATMPHIGLYFRTNAIIYKASIHISEDLRDLNVFSTTPLWYMYVEDQGE